MSRESTSRKLAWREAVARERALPRSAVALAILLACRYFNGESGEAWPAQRTLAHDLGIRSGTWASPSAAGRGRFPAEDFRRPARIEPLPNPEALARRTARYVGMRAARMWAWH